MGDGRGKVKDTFAGEPSFGVSRRTIELMNLEPRNRRRVLLVFKLRGFDPVMIQVQGPSIVLMQQ